MKANEILEDIYRVCEEPVRECNYDVTTPITKLQRVTSRTCSLDVWCLNFLWMLVLGAFLTGAQKDYENRPNAQLLRT